MYTFSFSFLILILIKKQEMCRAVRICLPALQEFIHYVHHSSSLAKSTKLLQFKLIKLYYDYIRC